MYSNEHINTIDKHNLWKKFFNKLTTGFSTVISFLLQNPFSSRIWVARNEEKLNQIDRAQDDKNYHKNKEPKRSNIELNIGHHLLTYQAMQIKMRVSEIGPPPGYVKVLQILRSQTTRVD